MISDKMLHVHKNVESSSSSRVQFQMNSTGLLSCVPYKHRVLHLLLMQQARNLAVFFKVK
jgi:hypothetical protein